MMATTIQTDNPETLSAALHKARTAWLKDYLFEHLPLIGGSEADWQAWDTAFKQFLCDRGLTEPKQQKNPITQARAAIKVAYGEDHPALAVIALPTAVWLEINKDDRASLDDRETRPIQDPAAVVERAQGLIEHSPDWAELMLGLALVTGRRSSEILATATFAKVSDWSVLFRGQLKRGGKSEEVAFEIPTLVPADLVVAGLGRLRELLPEAAEMSPVRINQCYGHALGQACDRLFSELIPPRSGKKNIHPHVLRAAYAAIAAHWFCPPQIPVVDFRAYTQGHFDDSGLQVDISSQRHYLDFAIADADADGNIDGRLGIRLDEEGVQVVSYFQTRLKRMATATKDKKDAAVTEDGLALSPRDRDSLLALGKAFGANEPLAALHAVLDFADPLVAWCRDLQVEVSADSLLEALPDDDADADGDEKDGNGDMFLAQAAALLRVQPDSATVLAALGEVVRRPTAPDPSLMQGVSAQVMALAGQLKSVTDSVGELRNLVESQQQRQDNLENGLAGVQQWMQQSGPALQMFAAFGQMNSGQSPPVTPPVPVTAPPQAPLPPTPTASSPPDDRFLSAQSFLQSVLSYNQQVQAGDRVYVSADMMRRLLHVPIKYRKKAYDSMKPHIQHQHDEYNLSHWANQDRDFNPLLAWLQQHHGDLPLRNEVID